MILAERLEATRCYGPIWVPREREPRAIKKGPGRHSGTAPYCLPICKRPPHPHPLFNVVLAVSKE